MTSNGYAILPGCMFHFVVVGTDLIRQTILFTFVGSHGQSTKVVRLGLANLCRKRLAELERLNDPLPTVFDYVAGDNHLGWLSKERLFPACSNTA